MNKREIVHVIRSLSFSDYFEFLEWLYGNGYEIVKAESPKSARATKLKSKFMEEWEAILDNAIENRHPDIRMVRDLATLIDKHKADK